jgi:hypothetical protein
VLAYRTRPRPGAESNFQGSLPSSRHQPAASTLARDSRPALRSVLGVSHALDGFLRHRPSWVCFTPQPRPGFALQGFVPPALPHGLVVRRFPRAVVATRLRPRLPVTAPANRPPTSGPCSAPESRASTTVLPAAGPTPLLGFSSSGSSYPAPWDRFRGPSVRGFHQAALAIRLRNLRRLASASCSPFSFETD